MCSSDMDKFMAAWFAGILCLIYMDVSHQASYNGIFAINTSVHGAGAGKKWDAIKIRYEVQQLSIQKAFPYAAKQHRFLQSQNKESLYGHHEGPDIQQGAPTAAGIAGPKDETIVAWNLWGPRLLMKHFPPSTYSTSAEYL